jgi:hypothetical protein
MTDKQNTLFSLVQQAVAIERMIHEAGGEITPELENLMSNVDVNLPEKIDGYKFVIDTLEARAAFFKSQAEPYLKAAKSLAALGDKLSLNIKQAMLTLDKKEIEGNAHRFVISGAKPKLVINPDVLPSEWKMQVVETVPDKERIKTALDEGFSVTGASYEPSFSLRTYVNKKEGK